jgi:hypothetical protein
MAYVPYLPYPNYGENPWGGVVEDGRQNVEDAAQQAGNIPEYNQALQAQMAYMNQYAQQTQPVQYPAMENDYGIGQEEKAKADSTVNNRSLNPWSLVGEAMAR